MKKVIKYILNFLGFKITRIQKTEHDEGFYSELNKLNIVDIEKLTYFNSFINGMISDYQAKIIFVLCYFQTIKGDVLEIGSFKGKSTSYIFRAVKETKNGSLYVIDNFKGISGKEYLYGDFINEFLQNMKKIGNNKEINILNGDSKKMLKKIKNDSLRFIYIDGDHSYEGIKKDLYGCLPKLKNGGIIVLDDYFDGFPDLVKSVNEIIGELKNFSYLTFAHNLVIIKNIHNT